MKSCVFVVIFLSALSFARKVNINKDNIFFNTYVTTKNLTGLFEDKPSRSNRVDDLTYRGNYIDVHVVDKPHNLFIGRCSHDQKELHGENIILNNDGKSHVSAVIRFSMDGPVYITCVKVLDQRPENNAYPNYKSGGVGYNFVEIDVTTVYGRGFNFFVHIFGYYDKKEVPQQKGKPLAKLLLGYL